MQEDPLKNAESYLKLRNYSSWGLTSNNYVNPDQPFVDNLGSSFSIILWENKVSC